MASRANKPKKHASYSSRDSQSPLQDTTDVETEQSEESQAISMGTVMTKMVTTQRKRHAAKKKAVFEDYDATHAALEASVNAVFAEHEAQAAAAHEAQLKRLQEMLAYKAKLEKELAGVFADLKASYEAHSQDVEMVIAFKAKEL